jgi:nicotinate-nucleotide adenylyltransferase
MTSDMTQKIGVLGGSFDPIHVGHLAIAQQVANALSLKTVLLIPAGRPPHKSLSASPEERLAMCRLAVANLRGLDVDDCELHRDGVTYTIDTIGQLQERLGGAETYFLIGADTVPELPTWHRIEELVALTNWAIVERPGFPPADFAALEAAPNDVPRLSADAVRRLRAGVVKLDEPVEIASSEIRRRLAEDDHVRGLLRGTVLNYIHEKGLYGTGE